MNYVNFVGENAHQLIGFLLPPFVTVLNTQVSDSRAKFFMSIFVCLFVALLMNVQKLVTGTTWESVDSIFTSAMLVFSESQVVYRLYFKGSAVEAHIEAQK